MRRGGLPGGGGDQREAGPPAGVEPTARFVDALRGAHQIQRVREPEGGDTGGEQHPRAVEPPAGAGERADAETEQHEVEERIGEPGGDGERLAAHAVEHGLEHDRATQRGDAERGGETVEPQAARHAAGAGAQQRERSGEDERREQQVAGVGERRQRRIRIGPQDGRVVDLAQRPGEQAAADQGPGSALRPAHERDAREADQRRRDQGDVVGAAREHAARIEVGGDEHVQLIQAEPRRAGSEQDAKRTRSGHHVPYIGARMRGREAEFRSVHRRVTARSG
jgi:hypothetical protein